jgi:hypothetical protein
VLLLLGKKLPAESGPINIVMHAVLVTGLPCNFIDVPGMVLLRANV